MAAVSADHCAASLPRLVDGYLVMLWSVLCALVVVLGALGVIATVVAIFAAFLSINGR